jgi:hypothetical protein
MLPDLAWTLWTSPHGETVARLAHLSCQMKADGNWSIAHPETPLALQVNVPDYLDPRQAHMDEIFMPGRFTPQAILKAINVSFSFDLLIFWKLLIHVISMAGGFGISANQ